MLSRISSRGTSIQLEGEVRNRNNRMVKKGEKPRGMTLTIGDRSRKRAGERDVRPRTERIAFINRPCKMRLVAERRDIKKTGKGGVVRINHRTEQRL